MKDHSGHTNVADFGSAEYVEKACSCRFRVTVEVSPIAPVDMANRIATAAYEAHLEES